MQTENQRANIFLLDFASLQIDIMLKAFKNVSSVVYFTK